jgi:lipopolysaccharide biosynthesis regulator YciM
VGLRASLRRWRDSGGPPERLLRRALRHLIAGDDDAAEAALTGLVRKHADEVDAYLGLAEIYRRRGEVGRSIALYQNLNLRNDLDHEQRITVLAGLAHAFEDGGYEPRAVATFEQVLERDPDHAAALAGLARMLPGQGDHERALVVERRRAKLRGARDRVTEARLLTAIAERRLAEGRDDVARHSARRALKADFGQVDALLALARIEENAQRPKRVVEHLVAALDTDPGRAAEILPKLERAWPDGAGRRGDWVEFLEDAAKRHSDRSTLVDALARALAERDRADEAIEVLEAGLVRWPDDDALRMRLGRILLDLGRYDEALTAYESMLDLLEKRRGTT